MRGTVPPVGLDNPQEAENIPQHDPLLHLSFDEPAAPPSKPAADPALDLHMDDPLPARN